MIIRAEKSEEVLKIREIHMKAFNAEAEANLVEALRRSKIPLISLVAEENNEPVGHILFSPATLEDNKSKISIAGLAPMAVLPAYQKRGIGSALIEEGLRHCREIGYDAVVVLGYPEYYQRFGFVPSVKYGIKSQYKVPEDVFMVKELNRGALTGSKGTVKYHSVFMEIFKTF